MLPVLDFRKIWSNYFKYIWTVFVLKWYLDTDQNMLKLYFQIWRYTKQTVEISGYCDIKTNARPLSLYKQSHL